MKSNCHPMHLLTLHEADELLCEVCTQAAESSQTQLSSFAGLLRSLIAACQAPAEPATPEQIAAVQSFVAQGLDEIQVVLETSPANLSSIDELSEQAFRQWGDLLQVEVVDSGLNLECSWQPSLNPPEPVADETELTIPSASDIQQLLQQLSGQFPALPVQDPQPLQTPPATQAPQPASPSQLPPAAVTTAYLASQAPQPSVSETATTSAVAALDPELREAFMDDAASCLGAIEQALLRLEANQHDSQSLTQVLRELHTLKGASGSVGLLDLADQIHHLEDRLRDDATAGRAPAIDALLNDIGQIRGWIMVQPQPTLAAMPHLDPAAASLVSPIAAPAAAAVILEDDNDNESVRVKSSQLNRLMDMLVELVMVRNQRDTELMELQEVYHTLITCGSKMRLLSNDRQFCTDSGTSLQLSEVASDVLEIAQQVRDCARPFAAGNATVSRFIRQFRQELVALRRTPISGLFRRLQLVARDAARAEDKQVQLVLQGEDAGIERSLQQRLYEPLLHIVRNCICHGIETAQERRQAGKPEQGSIRLEATSGPNLFVIEVCDDGRGLDYEAIRRRGVERKLITADQVLTRDELSMLIFTPGFSTRESATQVAGRGVGMDVVATTMHRMRGWLEISSEPGQGTRVRLNIPLPSVIQHAMLFRCADQLFALPMEAVQSAGEVPAGLPTLSFAHLLGQSTSTPTSSQAIVVVDRRPGVSLERPASLALCVDEIVGPEELVVRPLPSLLKQHPYCVGATLSGMGHTVILLDVRRLMGGAAQSPTTSGSRTSNSVACAPRLVARPRVLVVDDSLSARKRVVRSLSRYPLEIVEAADGQQALNKLKKQRFAAIFSDMEMPNVDGMELLASVHATGRSDAPPMIIISSRVEREFTDRARQLGAANYLSKPVSDEALDAALLQLPTLRHLVGKVTPSELEKLA